MKHPLNLFLLVFLLSACSDAEQSGVPEGDAGRALAQQGPLPSASLDAGGADSRTPTPSLEGDASPSAEGLDSGEGDRPPLPSDAQPSDVTQTVSEDTTLSAEDVESAQGGFDSDGVGDVMDVASGGAEEGAAGPEPDADALGAQDAAGDTTAGDTLTSPDASLDAGADSGLSDAELSAPDVLEDALEDDVKVDADEVSGAVDADAQAPDAELTPPEPLFLLSINNTTDTLEKIDVETGMGTDLCALDISQGYPSLTFSRDNVLFASRGGTALDVIDPCTCEVTPVASYGGYSGVNGITSDQGLNLFGVASTQDEFINISTSAGLAQSVGPLGVDFGSSGATWSEADQTVYAINASDDALYEVAPDTGVATMIAPLSLPFGTVGIEMHPANGVLYACSSAAILLQVDTLTGEVTEIGHTGQEGSCSNLAAPWKSVPCLQ